MQKNLVVAEFSPYTSARNFQLEQQYLENICQHILIYRFIIKFPYNARCDWLKQRPLSENTVQVNDIKLAFKFLPRNFRQI